VTYFPNKKKHKLQQLVVLVTLSLVVLTPNLGISENSPFTQQSEWALTQNSYVKGIIDLDEYTYDATSYNQFRIDSSLDIDPNNKAIDGKEKNSNIYQQKIDDQSQIEKLIDPWVDTGDRPPKNIAVEWNQKQPLDMSIKSRPFHSIEIMPSELKKIEIKKGLAGDVDDLSACYNINHSTSAEIVQQGSTALFLVNYSGEF
jgi:hypothetical protein